MSAETVTPPVAEAPPAKPDETKPAETKPAQQTDGQGATADSPESELLSPEELADIKKDPKLQKLHKSLNRAWTQKTQSLSKERQDLESKRLFLDAYEKNPAETIKLMAAQHGLSVADIKAAAAKDQTGAKLEALFGPNVAPDVKDAVNALIEDRMGTVKQELQQVKLDAAGREATRAYQSFKEAHPDFHAYEDQITKLSEKLGGGINFKGSPTEYLEFLYETTKGQVGTAAAVIKQMKQSAEVAEPPASGVAETRLDTKPKVKSIAEAFALARKEHGL